MLDPRSTCHKEDSGLCPLLFRLTYLRIRGQLRVSENLAWPIGIAERPCSEEGRFQVGGRGGVRAREIYCRAINLPRGSLSWHSTRRLGRVTHDAWIRADCVHGWMDGGEG
jgi:hypothetical protein